MDPTTTIEDLKALCEFEFGVSYLSQIIVFKKRELMNSVTLGQAGVMGLDKLVLVDAARKVDPERARFVAEAQKFVAMHRNNPAALQQLMYSNPPLYELVIA